MYKDIFEGKTILITGGTGFLGKALVKQILKFNPHSIRVFSRDEVKHHNLNSLHENDPRIRCLLGDIRDKERVGRAIEGVDIVIHAAALKRLDMIEYNVAESIKTNIIGTLNVAEQCINHNIEKAIFVSTDKACSAINTYGACKFIGERIFTESNYSKGAVKTVLSSVRYGNVLESTGSVIPFFINKIKTGQDIPITDENMTRFIIDSDSAVELIFKAIKYSEGGEVFIPKLPSFRITDLADAMKEELDSKVENYMVGIRPGEKIHELMLNQYEVKKAFEFEGVLVLVPNIEKVARYKYLDPSKRYDKKIMSSEDNIISKDKLKKILIKLNVFDREGNKQ